MNLLSENSKKISILAAPIETFTGICAAARGPPLSQMIRNVNENWEGTLMGLTAGKEIKK